MRPRAPAKRERGRLSPEGYYRDSFDYASLISGLVEPFASGEARIRSVQYDYRREASTRVDVVGVRATAVLVFDGVFLLRPELRRFWTLAVYLAITPEERMRRAVAREVEMLGSAADVEQRDAKRYLPGQALYRQEASPESHANVVVDNSEPTAPTILRWAAPAPL